MGIAVTVGGWGLNLKYGSLEGFSSLLMRRVGLVPVDRQNQTPFPMIHLLQKKIRSA